MHASTNVRQFEQEPSCDEDGYESIFDDHGEPQGDATQWPPPRKRAMRPARSSSPSPSRSVDDLIAQSQRIRRECDALVHRYELALGVVGSSAERPRVERAEPAASFATAAPLPPRERVARPMRRRAAAEPPRESSRSGAHPLPEYAAPGGPEALVEAARGALQGDARAARRKALLMMMIEELL